MTKKQPMERLLDAMTKRAWIMRRHWGASSNRGPQATSDRRRLSFANMILVGAVAIVAVVALAWSPQVANAQSTLLVTNTNDSGPGSLREAVANAAAGDSIEFGLSGCPCTITLTSGEIVIDKPGIIGLPSLTIGRPDDHRDISISANNASRIFRIVNGQIEIFRLGLKNGNVPDNGGAIYNEGSLSLHLVGIYDSIAGGSGGGIYNAVGGSLNLFASVIQSNQANVAGGGISGTSIFVQESLISGNAAFGGAGPGKGGGIYNSGDDFVYIRRSTIVNNFTTGASAQGGGLYNAGGVLAVVNSTVSGNSVDGLSGSSGGGIYNDNGALFLTFTTITQNIADYGMSGSPDKVGGGVSLAGGTANVKNTIIAGNTAYPDFPDVWTAPGATFTSAGYNLIGVESGDLGFNQPTDQNGDPSNPLDAGLGFLQYNGGMHSTHALMPGSPAIDKGAEAFDTVGNEPTPHDQRVAPRPVDDPAIPNAAGGDGSDIGAFEVQLDTDGDGVPDATDNCPVNPNPGQENSDGDAQGDVCDADDDNDGVADTADNCQYTSNTDQLNTDGDALGNACDPDDDNDGVADTADNCPLVANPSQSDSDNDGVGDACETVTPPDTDGDGVSDATDNCPSTPNPNQENHDGDALGDACDPDDDNDGQTDADEITCGSNPLSATSRAADNDNDNRPDCVDPDDDNDAVIDSNDNCPLTSNPGQGNNDGDALGDACDPDDDNDGVLDSADNCQFTHNPNQANNDGDAIGDACDADNDNDGVSDTIDNCPFTANPDQANNDGDAQGNACDPDDDNDGVLDGADNCPLTPNSNQLNTDGDAFGNVCDPDDDNDGVLDGADNCPLTPNPTQSDSDGDGIGDACDTAQTVFPIVFSRLDGGFRIFKVNSDGSGLTRLTTGALDLDPAISPDGTQIAFQRAIGEIYRMNANGGNVVRMTNDLYYDTNPDWSPNSGRLVFSSYRYTGFGPNGLIGGAELIDMNAALTTSWVQWTTDSWQDLYTAWSPDGSKIAFSSNRFGNNFEIVIFDRSSHAFTRLTNNSAIDTNPSWSPDGTKIVFATNRDGNYEIYSMNANGTGLTRLTNNSAADTEPWWGPDGRIVFTSTRNGNTQQLHIMNANGGSVTRITNGSASFNPHW